MKSFICFLLILTLEVFTQVNSFRIFPGSVTQTEPVVAVSPVNPLFMFVSGVTINTSTSFRSEGVYITTNGGLNWFGSDTCTGNLIINHGGDPAVAIAPDGDLILTHIGSLYPGVYSHYSTNLGVNWSSASTISNLQPEDKGSTIIDNNPSSPFYGRLYSIFVNLVTPFPVRISTSTNKGQNWTTPLVINPSPLSRCSGGTIATAKNGTVYTCWAGMTSSSPYYEDFVGFASSSDGGVNWSVNQNIFDANGITGTLSSKGNIRVNGLPSIEVDNSGGTRNGWVYIVTTDINLSPAGTDPDIVLHRSTDGGATWSAGIRVNQDALNNGKIQYFPSITIDSTGGINILFYDDRNTSADSAEVFLARSTDGGNTWKEFLISNHRFKPKPIIGGSSNYQGDHIAVASIGKKIFCFWMDDFSGLYQIWLGVFDFSTNPVDDGLLNSVNSFSLEQNYPNPFNPSTKIKYQIANEGYVSLKIYDILGNEINTLVNQHTKPGLYDAEFFAENMPAGVYFYCLKTEGFVETKKMILLR